MTGIPYNYGKYIDDTVKLKDQGVVDAGKQVQSPASAGSRGLTKTTQFTKDRTQMQMGQTAISESMADIRTILNRIDGVNVQELDDKERTMSTIKHSSDKNVAFFDKMMKRYGPNLMELIIDHSHTISNNEQKGKEKLKKWGKEDDLYLSDYYDQLNHVDEDLLTMLSTAAETNAKLIDLFYDKVEQAKKRGDFSKTSRLEDPQGYVNLSREPKGSPEYAKFRKKYGVKEDEGDERAIAAMKLARDEKRDNSDIDIRKLLVDISSMKDRIAELAIDDDAKTSAFTALAQVEDDIAQEIKGKFPEDSGELSRLKELSGIQEDAELTDEQEKGLEAIAKKYKDREGGNGDELARGHIKALTSSGITTDGFDVEEMEAYAKKIGKDWPEWEDEIDDFLKQAPITSGMMDDMNKVLGPDWEQNEKLSAAAADVLDKSAGFVPMPEGDEFNIEDDEDFEEVLGPLGFPEDETELFDAEYRGRKVPLNKPMRGDVKKFKVYVKDPKTGNVKKVNFGHGGTSAKRKTMRIRKSNPKARKSFRARHNCANPGPKTKARYWSCRKW